MIVQEFDFWSPTLGADACRISMAGENGGEFFAIVRRSEGRQWRETRKRAIEALGEAVMAGWEPGEVRWRTTGADHECP